MKVATPDSSTSDSPVVPKEELSPGELVASGLVGGLSGTVALGSVEGPAVFRAIVGAPVPPAVLRAMVGAPNDFGGLAVAVAAGAVGLGAVAIGAVGAPEPGGMGAVAAGLWPRTPVEELIGAVGAIGLGPSTVVGAFGGDASGVVGALAGLGASDNGAVGAGEIGGLTGATGGGVTGSFAEGTAGGESDAFSVMRTVSFFRGTLEVCLEVCLDVGFLSFSLFSLIVVDFL